MQIGDLFLNLGIRGTEKTVGGISNVNKSLSETASISLEAKAGIIGAMYALEQLFAASGKTGTALTNFNALTGVSAETLQRYQYAARQVGISNEEVANSFQNLQSVFTKASLGLGAPPAGLAQLNTTLQRNGFAALTQREIKQYAAHPEDFLQVAQHYRQIEKDVGKANEVLKSFGLTNNIIAAQSRNAFRKDVLDAAPILSDHQLGQLDKSNKAWSNLGSKIGMAVAELNAQSGVSLAQDFDKMVSSVIKLVHALESLNKQFQILQTVAHGLEGLSNIFKLVGEIADRFGGKESKKGDLLYQGAGQEAVPGLKDSPLGHLFHSLTEKSKSTKVPSSVPLSFPLPVVPKTLIHSPNPKTANHQTNQITISNTFSHPGVEPKKTEESLNRSLNQALRQMSAQTQGT